MIVGQVMTAQDKLAHLDGHVWHACNLANITFLVGQERYNMFGIQSEFL